MNDQFVLNKDTMQWYRTFQQTRVDNQIFTHKRTELGLLLTAHTKLSQDGSKT